MLPDSLHDMLQSWLKDDRFYNVQLQSNLFGGISVFCNWGSTYGKRGGCKIIFCDNELDAADILQMIEKRRSARGYRLLD